MKIFDAHCHIFPNKIASKASDNIGNFYGLKMEYDGSVETLMELYVRVGISKCLVQSVATVPEQVPHINDFIAESIKLHPTLFVGFCALHPLMEKKEIEAEIDRAIALGLKGIKLHPDFQEFKIDDRKVYDIYEAAEGRLPILFHTGDKRFDYSSPKRLANALKDFPRLTAIAAHFGGWSEWEDGRRYLAGNPNVYVDTSSSLYALSPERAVEYIKDFTPDRVMFGTDYPMWSIENELKLMERLELSDSDREKIMYKTACRLLNVSCE
ncbi:MAG: amidohydrolase family protein [Firmicutes bacterium]|nr:amidohydrolase family protein [Bacillota bacterium]